MMNRITQLIAALVCLIMATDVLAGYRRYASGLENSVWKVTTESRLQCELVHEIPHYGFATFSSEAHRKDNLMFDLDMLRLPTNYSVAKLESVPPAWRPGQRSTMIDDVQWRKQMDGDVPEKSAWVMLTELEKGNFPTLHYTDWHNQNDKVVVALAATNFSDAYLDFLNCRAQLLPYSFEDIANLDLQFEFGGSALDKASKKKLMQVQEYLKHDKDIESITVNAYSDSWGGRWHNLQVSKKRANQVKDFFVQAGIDADKISVTGFGEKRHIASNQTELGRQENRRVVIEMIKP